MVDFASCPPPQLTFGAVLSRRTAYGLIWNGQYQHQACVVKMIMLTTGIHYDKNMGQYQTANGLTMTEKEAERYFGHNDCKPFFHVDFRHRRSMTPEAFFKELDDLIDLGQKGIAPTVYGYGINQSYPIHYAFIVMVKVDCSLKDIYLRRDLSVEENQIILGAIDHLHNDLGILHGDLKPSNMGVYLDRAGNIRDACFFDCQKIRHCPGGEVPRSPTLNPSSPSSLSSLFSPSSSSQGEMSLNDFKRLSNREINNFKKHIIKNMEEPTVHP